MLLSRPVGTIRLSARNSAALKRSILYPDTQVVSANGESRLSAAAAPSSGRMLLVFLLLFSGFAVFYRLGAKSLENQDNLKFAEIAREIGEFQDWTLLREGGELYVDKPPLHFWITACLYRVFGVNEFAARLPSALFAFLLVIMAYAGGRSFLGSRTTAATAALGVLAAYVVIWYARRARIDVTFAAFFSGALLCFFSASRARTAPARLALAAGFWLAAGCAGMTKGPVGPLCLLPITLFATFLCLPPALRRNVWAALGITFPLMLLPIAPWALALWHHPLLPRYLEKIKAATFLTRHENFFYYFYEFPLKFLPTTPFLAAAIVLWVRNRKALATNRGLKFSVVWLAGYMVLLQAVSTKSNRYLLAAAVPVGILSAWGAENAPGAAGRLWQLALRWYDRVLLGVCVVLFALPFGVAYAVGGSPAEFLLPVLILTAVLYAGRRFAQGVPAKLLVTFVVGFLATELAREARDERTARYRSIVQTVRQLGIEPEELGLAELNAPVRGALGFYFGKLPPRSRPLRELLADDSVKAILIGRERWSEEEKKPALARILQLPKKYLLLLKKPSASGAGAFLFKRPHAGGRAAQPSINKRSGFSMNSLTRTKNLTASAPSTMR